MELQNISPFDLVPNPWNTNRVDRENFDKLKKSLQSLGSFKPIVVRELEGKFQILGGFHRVEAAKELGFPTVPIINIGNIDEDRAKEISLVDNTRYGEDDVELLAKLLDEMDTELLVEILPEAPVTLDAIDTDLEDLDKEMRKEREEDENFKTLRFRLDIDKAEEIENVLDKIAFVNNYKRGDGYADFAEALYHALILDRK
jgi:ParB-like chromosome segregation protein Spo0J